MLRILWIVVGVLVLHFAVVNGRPDIAYYVLLALILSNMLFGLRANRRVPRIVLTLLVVMAALTLPVLSGQVAASEFLVWAPAIIYFCLMTLFGSTLLPDRIPLITQVHFTRIETPTLAGKRYTFLLTVGWTIVFMVFALQAAWLASHSDLATWSWWTNILNPLIMLVFFLGEHLLRPRGLGSSSPIDTMRAIANTQYWTQR